MAGAARIVGAPLRHEARHDVEPRPDLLGGGLEQNGAVGLLERFGKEDRRLVDAGTRFRVQALDRNAERARFVEQCREKRLRRIRAQQRVTEHSRRNRLGTHTFLGRPRLRRLGEVEPFEFHPAHRREALFFRALQHAFQHLPRAQRKRLLLAVFLPHEVTQEERHVVIPRHMTMRTEIDARHRVGKALVPAGDLRVVVTDVLRIPAEHDVAKTEAAVGGRRELVLVHVLAAEDAVDVGDGHFDAGPRRLADRLDHFGGGERNGHPGLLLLSWTCLEPTGSFGPILADAARFRVRAAVARWHHGAMPPQPTSTHVPPHLSPAGSLAALHVGVALFGLAGLFGKWIAWDPVAIVLGRTAVAAMVLVFVVRYRKGALRLPALGMIPERRDPGRALGRVLHGDQGVDRRHRTPGLCELSDVRAAARARDAAHSRAARRDGRRPRWSRSDSCCWCPNSRGRATRCAASPRARHDIAAHYDLGDDLYATMLGPTMTYSCGYWRDAVTLTGARRTPSTRSSAASSASRRGSACSHRLRLGRIREVRRGEHHGSRWSA